MPELSVLVFLPAVAAAAILLLPKPMEQNAKWVALAAASAMLVLSVQMFFAFDLDGEGYQFVERHEWVDIGQFNLQYFLGVDGLSMPLVLLTTCLTVASVLVSFSVTVRPRAYFACLMLLASSVVGVFVALDFLLFFTGNESVAEERNVLDRIDIIEGTFGKAYGAMGGFITGKKDVIDSVRCFAGGFIFTTSLPPSVLASAHAAVEHLKVSQIEREKQRRNVNLLKDLLTRADLPFMQGPTHIVPLVVGDPNCCREVTDILMRDYGIYVQPINYPTVPRGTERLRLTATAAHSTQDIEQLAGALEELWNSHHALRAVA